MTKKLRLAGIGLIAICFLGLVSGCGSASSGSANSKGLPSSLSTGAQ